MSTTIITGTDFITVATKDFEAARASMATCSACRSQSNGARCPPWS